MYFLHAIDSDRQTRLLNVLGQIAMILGDKRKILVGTKSVSSLQNVQTGLGGYRLSYSVGTRGSFLWLKWPERQYVYSSTSRDDAKNEWNYISRHSYPYSVWKEKT